MAQSIVLKRSALSGKVPGTSSLSLGEVAINTYDGRVFFKKSGSIESVEHILTTNSVTSGSITLTKTGSFGELVVSQDGNFSRDIFVTRDIVANGDLDILGSLTASIQQGYVWVGNASGKTALVSTSSFGSNISLSSLNTYTSSLITAFTASGTTVTFNGNQIVNGAISIGTASLGSSENTLVLGVPPAGGLGEGGQILLQASGGLYTSASMLDNYQNLTRLLRGTNAGSDAVIVSWNMHTKQMQLPAYNAASSFVGTATANLAVNSNGDVITVSTSGGTVFPYTGNAVITGSLIVTNDAGYSGAITASGPIRSLANGQAYFRGGDDAEFWDINVVNTVGIYGIQDQTIASIKLGSNGGTISGKNGNIGIATIDPSSGSLHVNGNIFATSITGAIAATNGVVSGSSQIISILSSINSYTGSNDTKWTTLQTITSSILTFTSSQETKNTTLTNVTSSILSFTSSTNLRLSNIESTTASILLDATNLELFTGSQNTKNSTLATYTGSNDTKWTTLQNVTSSILSFTSSQETKDSTLSAITSSLISRTGSYATTGSNSFLGNQFITGSLTISSSVGTDLIITGAVDITGSLSASLSLGYIWVGGTNNRNVLVGTSSLSVLSSSFATNADLLDGAHLASLATTGSNVFSGSQVISGSLNIFGAQFNATSSATATGTTIVSSYATTSFNSAFYNYYISSGSNARAGQIMSLWSGSTVNYTEITTTDFGNTSTASLAVTLASGNVRLSFTAPGVWTVKSIVNLL